MVETSTETWDTRPGFQEKMIAKLKYEKLARLSQSKGITRGGA